MAQTTISIKMDDSLKKEFDRVCNDLGLSMSTAITMLAKKWLGKIGFRLKCPWIPFIPKRIADA